uniref:Uncharacterized protein n=1 Tax=Candidatus Kentrum sp. TC TaxID=2126339 RepID=A0A450YYM4_9GAMM|nr:MAG: hypothetical protein BECKTC1821E_GA0114239_106725 [Candidatus Kentron sp. TC]
MLTEKELQERKERIRWGIIQSAYHAHPSPVSDFLIQSAVKTVVPDVASKEILEEANYLQGTCCAIISLRHLHESNGFSARITKYGIDIVQRAVRAPDGIGAPGYEA